MGTVFGRLIGSSVVMAAAVAALPAHAADGGAVAGTIGATMLPMSLASASIAAAAPAPAEANYRLEALASPTASAPITLDSETSRLRHGFGSSMMSFFPLGDDGFHIGAGTRFWSRGVARPSVEPVYARLLYAPRAVLARATRRMTPALTAGYSRIVASGMTLGVEGGAMLGKFDSLAGALVRAPRLRRGDASDGAGRLNQVARMTFGYHF